MIWLPLGQLKPFGLQQFNRSWLHPCGRGTNGTINCNMHQRHVLSFSSCIVVYIMSRIPHLSLQSSCQLFPLEESAQLRVVGGFGSMCEACQPVHSWPLLAGQGPKPKVEEMRTSEWNIRWRQWGLKEWDTANQVAMPKQEELEAEKALQEELDILYNKFWCKRPKQRHVSSDLCGAPSGAFPRFWQGCRWWRGMVPPCSTPPFSKGLVTDTHEDQGHRCHGWSRFQGGLLLDTC